MGNFLKLTGPRFYWRIRFIFSSVQLANYMCVILSVFTKCRPTLYRVVSRSFLERLYNSNQFIRYNLHPSKRAEVIRFLQIIVVVVLNTFFNRLYSFAAELSHPLITYPPTWPHYSDQVNNIESI